MPGSPTAETKEDVGAAGAIFTPSAPQFTALIASTTAAAESESCPARIRITRSGWLKAL
jgi:hypothetical protein